MASFYEWIAVTSSLSSQTLARLRDAIERLAAIDRGSCSPGKHEAAEWLAAALQERGAAAEVEYERVHGTYCWPLGITSALGIAAAAAGARGRRLLGAAVGGVASALAVDDLGAGRRWLRAVLPKQVTANVLASVGDANAKRTLVVVSHHDAARTGIFFDPRISAFLGRYSSRRGDEPPRQLPLMAPFAASPALAGVGALFGLRALGRLVRWSALGSSSRSSRAHCARRCPVPTTTSYRLATDGQVPLRAGYPVAVISSMDWYKAPSNYHWPSDRPENVDVESITAAARLAEAFVRKLDGAACSGTVPVRA